MNLVKGKSYTFYVIQSNSNFSLVTLDSNEFYYPRELVQFSEVELSVAKVENGKVWFDTNPLKNTFESVLSGKLVSFSESRENVYAKINYKSHLLDLRFPRWLLKTGKIDIQKPIFFRSSSSKSKYPILKVFFKDSVEHYLFEYGNEYRFTVEEIKGNQLFVRSEDDIVYKTNNHFSNFKLKKDDKIELKFLGLTSDLSPVLVQSQTDFVAPDRILSKEDVQFLQKDKKFDYEQQALIKAQIKKSDNFWILSTIKFLPELVTFSFKNKDFETIFRSIDLFRKLKGFIISKAFFESIPPATRNSIEPVFDTQCVYMHKIEKLIDFQRNHEFSDLFSIKIIMPDNEKLEILNMAIKLGVTGMDSIDLYQKILINVLGNDSDKSGKLIRLFGKYFLKETCVPLLNKTKEVYFKSYNEKKEWLRRHNLEKISLISKSLIEHKESFRPSEILNFENVLLLEERVFNESNFQSSIVDFAKRFIKYFKSYSGIKPKPKIENNIVSFCDEIEILSSGTGLYVSEDKIFIIFGRNLHLFNYFLTKHKSIPGEQINSIGDLFYLVKVNFNQGYEIIQNISEGIIVDLIFKEDNANGLFVTHNFNDQFSEEGIIKGPEEYLPSVRGFYPGQLLKGKVSSVYNIDDARHSYFFDKSERYATNGFRLFNEVFRAKIISYHKLDASTCEKCRKPLKIHRTNFYRTCVNCNLNYFEYIELYIEDLEKSIFINQYSLRGDLKLEIFSRAEIGQVLKLRIWNEIKFKYLDPKSFKLNQDGSYSEPITRNTKTYFYKYHNVEVLSIEGLDVFKTFEFVKNYYPIEQKSINNRIAGFLFNGFVEIFMSLRDGNNKESENLVSYIRTIGRIVKSPKTYLIVALNRYKKLIESIINDLSITDYFIDQKNEFIEEYSTTINYYNEFHNIIDTLGLIELIRGDSIIELSQAYITHSDPQLKTLAKAILMRKLITDDEENVEFKIRLDDQIKGLLNNNISNLNFGSTFFNEEEEDENLKIIKDIEKGTIQENYIYEFKETLFLPVLNNEERGKIAKLKERVSSEKDDSKKEILIEQIKGIEVEKEKSWNNKQLHKKIYYSALKNIAAFLNTNAGKIIIGIRDTGELIGLSNDYQITGDFDGFQQRFEAYWQNLVVDHSTFRTYVKINRVSYNNMDFAVIDVDYPEDNVEPCLIYDVNDPKNQERHYLKSSSSTQYLSISESRKWKRKKNRLENQPTYVYLMKDSDGKIKIGHSKSPTDRQGTLMAKDTELKLIQAYLFETKYLANHFERKCQDNYEDFNVRKNKRGEWFDLDIKQIKEIDQYLRNECNETYGESLKHL